MSPSHKILGGKVSIYKRPRSSHWQCSAMIEGRQWRQSTKEDSLELAKEFAEDWYLGLRGKARIGELKTGKSFKVAAEQFEKEFDAITQGDRSPEYVNHLKLIIKVHLMPYFGKMSVAEITPGIMQEYRAHRQTSRLHRKTGEPLRPARSTLHHETIALRHVLKTAHRHGWIKYVPDFSPPYKSSPKIKHRAWFSREEYKQLYEATRKRAENPPKKRWKEECENLHDFVLFMVNTGLRPDEATLIEDRDVEVVWNNELKANILEISVRGKRGVGYCKSMPGAVIPYQRLKKRKNLQPTDKLFPKVPRELLNKVLGELGLKADRENQPRTAYSLRHTYICFRLMEGADIYQVAKNCRTSVEMIEKFYAAHIKHLIDPVSLNTMRRRPDGRAPKRGANAKRKAGQRTSTRTAPHKKLRKDEG